MIKSKPRGIRRKLNGFTSRLIEYTSTFPSEHKDGCGYWHLHLPISKKFIDSINTPLSVRRQVIKSILERVHCLIQINSIIDKPVRVVAAISLPNLFDSQIIVFYGNEYFQKFFMRNSSEQKWIPLPKDRDINKEYALSSQFQVYGYKEIIDDDDYYHEGEVWFLGELD